MRERITYIQKQGDTLEASSLSISPASLSGPSIRAVREDRLTLGEDELPAELRSLLKEIHELHVRWVSPVAYETVSPLLARLPAGFHLFYTPSGGVGGDGVHSTRLCTALQTVFGSIACSTPGESFTSLPADRFSHAAAMQYFQPLEGLDSFVGYVKGKKVCGEEPSCLARVDDLKDASALDVSWDAISHALKVTAFWAYGEKRVEAVAWREGVRTEVGVLSDEKTPTMEAHELGISGLLTVLGQDGKPSVTMFSFPSRHRDAGIKFQAGFVTPTGLHPSLRVTVGSNRPPVGEDEAYCAPHAYLTLPRGVFVDKYQLADGLFLASKNLTALRYVSQPVDLEAPEYVMKLWGSAVLVELTSPPYEAGEKEREWTAEIPMHLRYHAPAHGGYKTLEVPYPAVFWACAAEEGTKFPNNPFERVNLGYDGLFGPRTVFWHLEPRPVEGERVVSRITVPVLDLDKAGWVNVGTAAAVLLGFGWVVWKLLAVYLATGYGAATTEKEKEKKRQ
ncbi:PIG-X [Echria macrotheca]|uniref:Protein PBN1 n=1 Tax=Echria macrotheca TaxID=438768 RepID=A0AAJ0BDF6_9PEZI|nr:PIG-X [Echria macrotheca]